jgi:hypothetical protein
VRNPAEDFVGSFLAQTKACYAGGSVLIINQFKGYKMSKTQTPTAHLSALMDVIYILMSTTCEKRETFSVLC